MKCWNLVSNAQGWRVIIIDVWVGAGGNICSSVEAFKKNERCDKTQFTTKIG
jgi:hypothetical protein